MTDEWMDDGYENQYKGQGIMTINVIKIKELFVRTQCMPKKQWIELMASSNMNNNQNIMYLHKIMQKVCPCFQNLI